MHGAAWRGRYYQPNRKNIAIRGTGNLQNRDRREQIVCRLAAWLAASRLPRWMRPQVLLQRPLRAALRCTTRGQASCVCVCVCVNQTLIRV